MGLFFRVYICALFFSINAIGAESFDLGTSGIPLSVPGELRSGNVRSDEIKLTEEYQIQADDGRILFSNVASNPQKMRLAFSQRWNRDREKDVALGNFDATQVKALFSRVRSENASVLIDLGDGIYALGNYRILFADYSQENNPRVFAAFVISTIDENIETRIFTPQSSTVDVPLSSVGSQVFSLKAELFDASKPLAQHLFFLEATGEPAFPVAVIGYQGLEPENVTSPLGYAYVVSKEDLQSKVEQPRTYKVPVPFLRFSTAAQAEAIVERAQSGYAKKLGWLDSFKLDPSPALNLTDTPEQRLRSLQGLFTATLDTTVKFEKPLKSIACQQAVTQPVILK